MLKIGNGVRSCALILSGAKFFEDFRVPKHSYMGVSKGVGVIFGNLTPSSTYYQPMTRKYFYKGDKFFPSKNC